MFYPLCPVLFVLCLLSKLCAAQETCYPPGGVAGIVVATIIVTFVVGGLGTAVAYKLWTRKKGKCFCLLSSRVEDRLGRSDC